MVYKCSIKKQFYILEEPMYLQVSITFIQYIGDSIHFKTSLFTYY